MDNVKSRWTSLRRQISVCCLLCAATCLAQAHDPGLSAADLRLENGRLIAHLTFARTDLENLVVMDADKDGTITPTEFAQARPSLEALALSALEVQFDGNVVPAHEVSVQLDKSGAVHDYLSYPRVAGARLTLRSVIIARLARGHRQYLSLCDEEGKKQNELMLDASSSEFDVTLSRPLAPGTRLQSFRQFLVLGLEHILTGYDHLAFLLALLIAGGSFRAVAKIITSFTVAHSITLGLATFNVIQLPPSVVEPLIAVSIVYIGLENIVRHDLKRRWLLTFAFGLVHGLGFASALRELGIGSGVSGAWLPLLSFNVGVEFGQIVVAALLVPIFWRLKDRPAFVTRYAPACSVFVTIVGAYWLIERTLLKQG